MCPHSGDRIPLISSKQSPDERAGTSEARDVSVCVMSLLPVLQEAQESFQPAFNLTSDGWVIIRWSVLILSNKLGAEKKILFLSLFY